MTNFANSIFSRASTPLSFGILVLPESNMLSLAATVDPLRAANRRAKRQVFSWRFHSPDGADIPLTSGIDIPATALPRRPEFDVLVVVAGFNLTRQATPALMRRLREVSGRMKGVGGVDGGGWILARSGVLDGHTATTHWEDLEEFADVFTRINVVRDRFTLSGKFFTTGGAAPTIDMMLHLIKCRLGSRLAEAVASAFIYDSAKTPSSPQTPVPTAYLERTTPKVAQAATIMASRIENPPSIFAIAEDVGLSQRGLELLFKRYLAVSPGAYFRELRLQEARRLALDTPQTVQHIALRTGFASSAVFSRAFKHEFGISLSALRRLHSGADSAYNPTG